MNQVAQNGWAEPAAPSRADLLRKRRLLLSVCADAPTEKLWRQSFTELLGVCEQLGHDNDRSTDNE